MDVRDTTLMRFLHSKDDLLYGKALELRERIEQWLSYVPVTFMAFTRHTVLHSDEVIDQMSKLLFAETPETPVTRLSAAEAYVLVASAFLHDSGMVVSEAEKLALLRSADWHAWVTREGVADRWVAAQALRTDQSVPKQDMRDFLADLQTRHLIAEFFRARHAARSVFVIDKYEAELAGFGMGDPAMSKTISAVCRGHSLSPFELGDPTDYPYHRDLRGYPVDVRFCAILLRLGDLLDLSTNRACLLLQIAANPLPATSLAHWTKHQRFEHRATTPETIQLSAACANQDEHRLIQDWCAWIVEETRSARTLLARSSRHSDWRVPVASMEGPDPTIVIRPAEGATYVPSTWRLELDQDEIFKRLVLDVHQSPIEAVRELLQNALDAMRCRMYADLVLAGEPTPECPTDVPQSVRDRYSVRCSLRNERIANELTGSPETRQLLVIDDDGIGMDRDIIERFFLQVGRSYYVTDEFRRAFPFHPTSQFGVGFLSVFALSQRVVVDTLKTAASGTPTKLTLTGPRSYLLHDVGTRTHPGTRIEVELTNAFDPGTLTKFLQELCVKVEFPIHVDDLGINTTITAEAPESFLFDVPDLTDEGARLLVRHFPVKTHGVEGDLYVLAHTSERGERWDLGNWAYSTYPQEQPSAAVPELAASIVCVNGLVLRSSTRRTVGRSSRLDLRGSHPVNLGRTHFRGRAFSPTAGRTGDESTDEWEKVVAAHLRDSAYAAHRERWLYRQRLVSLFPELSLWNRERYMIPLRNPSTKELDSLEAVDGLGSLWVVSEFHREPVLRLREESNPSPQWDGPDWIDRRDLERMSDEHIRGLIDDRVPTASRFAGVHLGIRWDRVEDPASRNLRQSRYGNPCYLVAFGDSNFAGASPHKLDRARHVMIVNADHWLGTWLGKIAIAAQGGEAGLQASDVDRVIANLESPLRLAGYKLSNLVQYLAQWRNRSEVPMDLRPPEQPLTEDMFGGTPLEP